MAGRCFLVIQTGTIAAVAIGFARYLGVLAPSISPQAWVIHPIALSSKYAISLSVQQLVAVLLIIFLTFLKYAGRAAGKDDSEYFYQREDAFVVGTHFSVRVCRAQPCGHQRQFFAFLGNSRSGSNCAGGRFFTRLGTHDYGSERGVWIVCGIRSSAGGFAFSADAWNNIGFTAAEVKNPKRDVALSMAFGTIIVISLYVLANIAYLCALPLAQIQHAPDDRVASAALNAVFGPIGASIMAVAIIISTFGAITD